MNKVPPKSAVVRTHSEPQRTYEARLTYEEWGMIKRLRQLWGNGADIIIVEVRDNRPRVRQVGRLEG